MTSISSARWVEEGLGEKFAHLTALMPRGFASYVRLFHPARNLDGGRVRWADIAEWSGRKAHPLMAFERISSSRKGYGAGSRPWTKDPISGSLDREDAIDLARFLAEFTKTPENCFFAVWEGYGQFTPGAMSILTTSGGQSQFPPPEILASPRLTGVGRNYLLYSGPLSAISSFFESFWRESPTIWWPEDRTWCISTDIDLDSTYVGAQERCVTALAEDSRFEVLPTSLDAPVYLAADTLNSNG